MITILGLAGSLREGSFNAALLRTAAELAPEGARIEIGSIRGIPLYDGDVETREGVPAVVSALKERIVAADGLLLVTPEYNNSLPGVFKNAIDWLSRPGSDIPRVFGGRPVGVIGASPGVRGSALSQLAWLPVLRVLGTAPWFSTPIYVANAAKMFDSAGRLTDDATRERVAQYIAGFTKFVEQHRGAK
jgi:NAD(P)H-dependent FMN reductase